MSRHRNFCVTDFVLDKDFWETIHNAGKTKYIFAGEEVCPTTQKKHWQMFICYKSGRTDRSVRKDLSPRHVESMRGTILQNSTYCEKEGRPAFELGEKPAQGERTDLRELAECIRLGRRTVRDICEEDPVAFHKYGRTMMAIEDIALSRNYRTKMTKGIWYHGPTGTGKSHTAFAGYSPDTHYCHPVKDKGWWDGYQQQDIVIINDFRGEISYGEMLNLVDKWPHTVPRRCRPPIPFTSGTVIITSSQTPEQVYHRREEEDSIEQLLRRFDVKHCLVKHTGDDINDDEEEDA